MIPIKCFSCGKVLADKYRPFLALVKERTDQPVPTYSKGAEKSVHGVCLDDLNIRKECCRRCMITAVGVYIYD